MKHIAIVGAGLTGLACAIHLAKRGWQIDIFEARSHEDIQSYNRSIFSGRSMSMDLSARGIHTLKSIGIFDQVSKQAVAMCQKIFHDQSGQLTCLPLSPSGQESVLAVPRVHLFQMLLEKALSYPQIKIHFSCEFLDNDFTHLKVTFANLKENRAFELKPDILIGADGSNSAVRRKFEAFTKQPFKIKLIPQSYKELTIPAHLGKKLEPQAMHFWFRDERMLIAQPNADHSFTCALLMTEEGSPFSFAAIDTEQKIQKFFKEQFVDAYPLLADLIKEYQKNKPNHLRILQGRSWTCCGNFLLLGDAAHGTVPFFGQGVNCCFEDCTVLDECLNVANNHWQTALILFDQCRVKNGNAMSFLSFTNYPELFRSHVVERSLLKKQIEICISRKYPSDYITYHNLVCFSRVPYLYAMACKSMQEPLLERLADGIQHIDQLDWTKVEREIQQYKLGLLSNFNSQMEAKDEF